MQRIVIDRPGGYDALRLTDQADPTPGPDQLVIRTRACGVNYADGIIRMGLYKSAKQLHGYPITPGFEVAGVIDQVGDNVDGWQRGDEVIGLTLFNGYASHVTLPADGVFAKPDNLTFAQAATLPTVFLTAWWMVHRQVHPEPGGHLAGAFGGRRRGLGPAATGSPGRCAHHWRGSGPATRSIMPRRWVPTKSSTNPPSRSGQRPNPSRPGGFQAIFDANGVATLRQSYTHLAPTGRLVILRFCQHAAPRRTAELVQAGPRLAQDSPIQSSGHDPVQ